MTQRPDCAGCRERDSTIAALARTAGEYFARWIWTLKMLNFMPRPHSELWPRWLSRRLEALRGWDISGRPPHCPICHQQAPVIFVDVRRGGRSCHVFWLESSGTSPTTTSWREHVFVRYDEPGGDGRRPG